MKTKEQAFQEVMAEFEKWWFDEGSGIIPKSNDDFESHAKHVAESAWVGGASSAIKAILQG